MLVVQARGLWEARRVPVSKRNVPTGALCARETVAVCRAKGKIDVQTAMVFDGTYILSCQCWRLLTLETMPCNAARSTDIPGVLLKDVTSPLS